MNTLALSTPAQDGSGWDLVLDGHGNLAIATGPTALAQDVASAVRTFRGECWYDTTLGMPYFQRVLGKRVSLQFVKQALAAAGSIVPGVSNIAAFLTGPGADRVVGGQLQITVAATGQVVIAQTGNVLGAAPWWVNAAAGGAEAQFSTFLTDPQTGLPLLDPVTGLPMETP